MYKKLAMSLVSSLVAFTASANVTYKPLVRCEGGRVVLDEVSGLPKSQIGVGTDLFYQVVVHDGAFGATIAEHFRNRIASPTPSYPLGINVFNNGNTFVFGAYHLYPREKVRWTGPIVELAGQNLILSTGSKAREGMSDYKEWIFRGCTSAQF